ncbi:MAG: hypothetical protein ABJL67_09475 [Sulfitobacter sp.]
MRPLSEALQSIEAGWSPQTDIIQRASKMRSALKADDEMTAVMLADEIATLQEASAIKPLMPSTTRSINEEWNLDLRTWAEVLIGGGYLRDRSIWMQPGATVDEARDRACSILDGINWCEPEPVTPMKRTFAVAAE